MENTTVKAQGKYIRQSPYKMRLVLNLIRGLDVQEALNVLTFTKRRAAVEIKQVLESAISNACLLYTSPSPRDATLSRMPSSA